MGHGLTDAGAGRKPSDSAEATYKYALALRRTLTCHGFGVLHTPYKRPPT